ncbi:MAG: leucyl aminopeptidase [Flavobacteriales bacterium CG_4_9_14_3_um_filter_32_8]|nr:MAG: leucyl aminopeptidase [Flavobacteriales bacterium CG_4_9_14_3_um_filter_32_8]
MKVLYSFFFICTVLFSTSNYAQSYDNYYGSIVNQCSYDSIDIHLTELENLGVKEIGTAALDNTLNWLISKYTSYGYTNIEIDTFTYSSTNAYNLIVTKQGTVYPNTYVIVDGHYDTKTGTGTNDNGSGISIILETARLLQNVDTKYSIKFINFSQEEVGLVGSWHYVNNTVIPSNLDIKVLLNIDEVGGVNGMVNNTIVCERDESNPSANNVASANYTDTLANCVSLYSNLQTEISYAYSSDYMPFQSNNEIITGLFEKNQSPHPHTSTDLKIYLDVNYVYEIAKATIGASLYFAVAYLTTDVEQENKSNFSVYPNPAKGSITIEFNQTPIGQLKMTDIAGKQVKLAPLNSIKKQTFSIAELAKGIYFLNFNNQTVKIVKE